MSDPKRFKATRDKDGEYEYRGYRIRRNDDVAKSYWGRWMIHSKGFTTLREAKAYVDSRYRAN